MDSTSGEQRIPAPNITDPKNAEDDLHALENSLREVKEALAASEAKYKELAECFTDPFSAFDASLRLLYRNQAAGQLTLIPDEEAVGKTFAELYPYLVGGEIHQAFLRTVETREPHSLLSQVVRPTDGETFYVDIRVYPTQEGVVSFSKDITERVNAQKAIQKGQQKIREIMDSIHDGFFEVDRDWRFTYINSQAAQLSGVEPAALIGKNIWEVYPGLVGTALDRIYHQAMTGREPAHFETQGIFTQAWYDTRVYPSSDGITVYMVDITQRKKAEAEQRRLELESIRLHTEMVVQHRLAEYQERQRQAIARDLHDGLVQDLSSLIFRVQLTKESSREPKIKMELGQIRTGLRKSLHALYRMINDLRPPTLIQSGVIKAIHLHANDFREKYPHLRLELDLNPLEGETHLPEQINLALYRVYQEAMNNLAHHAQATQAWVKFEQVKDRVRLEVRDNGKGFSLSEGLIEHTEKNHFGLAGMKERAEAIGGELLISSAPGRGTVIQVSIPIQDRQP